MGVKLPRWVWVGAVTLVSGLMFVRLERNAAQQVSGHGN